MPLSILLAAAAVIGSLPLLWWALFSERGTSAAVSATLHANAGVTDLRRAILTRSAQERAVQPALEAFAIRARRLTPAGIVRALSRRVEQAGTPPNWPLERVLVAKVLLGAGGLALGLFLFTGNGGATWGMVGLTVPILGYFTPDVLLISRATQRQQQIEQELPDTLDQMTVCVEAGLGFESAMARAARSGTGVISTELLRTLQEIQIGVARAQALRNLADRTDVPDLRHFVLAVLQAESYGVPIARVLRVQAGEQRLKRRQRAEERAMKIPIKVLFPLVFFIFPTLFIILLGPAVIRIMETF